MKKTPFAILTGALFCALLCVSAAAEKSADMPLLIASAPDIMPLVIAPAPVQEMPLVSMNFHQAGSILRDAEGSPAADLVIAVSDADKDGNLTVNDAMILVHRYYYGTDDGYACEETDYGYSMTKLWGTTEGVGAFYLNGEMPWTDVITTPVSEGDVIDVILYNETWSDVYASFDRTSYTAALGQPIPLSLTYSAYDENWNAYLAPLAQGTVQVLTADGGFAASAQADENGTALLSVGQPGSYILAMTAEDMTLDSYAELTVLPYRDVVPGSWYRDALLSADRRGVLPEGEEFSPNGEMDKEFLDRLLFLPGYTSNYTLSRGKILSVLLAMNAWLDYGTLFETYADYDLSFFADADTLSERARVVAAWAYDMGIFCGRVGADGKLYADFDSTASRAEGLVLVERAVSMGMPIGRFGTEETE